MCQHAVPPQPQNAPGPPARGGDPHSRADDDERLHVQGGMHDGELPQGVVQNKTTVRNILLDNIGWLLLGQLRGSGRVDEGRLHVQEQLHHLERENV